MAVKKCDDIVEETEAPAEEAEGTTATTTQNETSQVKENSYLGKSLTAVERNIYDDISDELVDATGGTLQEKVLTTFGNARIHVVHFEQMQKSFLFEIQIIKLSILIQIYQNLVLLWMTSMEHRQLL